MDYKYENYGKKKIDWGYITTGLTAEWSPDSQEIAYFALSLDRLNTYGWQVDELKVSDIMGNKRSIHIFDDYDWYTPIYWIENKKIVADHFSLYSQLWLFDASGNGDHKELINDYDYYGEFFIAPDKRSFAFITSRNRTKYVNIADVNENPYALHELEISAPHCVPDLDNIVWSANSSKIAFIEAIGTCGDCPTACSATLAPHIVVADLKTKAKSILSYDSIYMFQWLSDNISILGQQRYDTNDGQETKLCAVNTEKGDIVNITFDMDVPYPENKLVSPLGDYLSFYKDVDPSSACNGRGHKDLWVISSLLNLTADLRVIREKASLILKGTAADLHFDGYVLEYADVNNPGTWNLITPPVDMPVISDVLATWVPPYEGIFYVKLTVWDKAGNMAMKSKRVSWGLSSSITNLYKSREIFSPNNDGGNDTVALHYKVLEPVHLDFTVSDANNNVISTIRRDYAAPADDSITWDGRDSSGKIVSEGKYRIKVFDYEFFVEVDNTFPDAGIILTEIKQDFDTATREGSLDLYVVLYGHAVDSNLKSWSIEYGEGENPSEWYAYFSGTDQIVGKDEDGEPVLNPAKDTELINYTKAGIPPLVGMKLRITAEDFAGNKSSDITDFLEEKIILHEHQWKDLYERFVLLDPDRKYPDLALPVMHIFGGLETIRVPIITMNLQYYGNRKWSDIPPAVSLISGMMDLTWDRSSDAQEINAVRIKGVDVMGMEHFSNEVLITSLFFLDLCARQAGNYLFEDLTLLKVQIRSDDDIRYAQWTDFQVYDAAKGDSIPVGSFHIYPNIDEDMHYKFRMIGIGTSDTFYIDQNERNTYPPSECGDKELPIPLKVVLKADYNEADCGLTADGIATLKAYLSGYQDNIGLKTLSYYLQMPEGDQLVRRFELSGGSLSDTTIDTKSLPEGSHPVKAVLSYLDLNDNIMKEIVATNSLIVDRVLPTAQITYPDTSLMLCPIKISDHKEDWYGINVEGITVDTTGMKRYELYYGIGENPAQWLPAMTRKYDSSRKAMVDAQITGNGPKQGELGVWNVTDMKGTQFSLKLKNIDIAGNVSCYTTDFSIDNVVEITNLSIDKALFSPNGDGVRDDITIHYQIDEYAAADVKVFELREEADGSYIPDTTPVRTIASGLQHLGGAENASWDGKDDSGMTVSDGRYAIAVLAEDSCGTTIMEWSDAEVDNTPPTAIITYPGPPDPIGNIVEVEGTADDTHFQSSTLEAGQGDSPDAWNLISSNSNPIQENILGIWNSFGLNGIWTLRLTASDTAGNKHGTTVVIDLGVRKDLIKDLSATPRLFSPNNDGRLDTVTINYELADACQVKINILDSIGVIKKTYTTTSPSAGTYSFIWDGRDSLNAIVSDGTYAAKLSAALSSNPSVIHEETITIIVDSTPPMIDIRQPLNNSFLKGDIVINGTIVDNNILDYSMTYSGDTGSALVDKANQNRENYIFGILDELPEGSYIIQAQAKDLGENSAVADIPFTIDRTPPKIILDNPKEGEYYGSGKNTISTAGVITEKNLDVYSLRYGLGDNPSQWTELASGNTIPDNPQLFTWQVGRADGIADGLYSMSLYAKDKAGASGEARVRITIDNALPEVSITAPQDGGYVRSSFDIKGTATDSNLGSYTLALSEGHCSSAFKWSAVRNASVSIKDGTLFSWQALPADGDYCFKLTAVDKSGNSSETKVNVKVDTHSPAAPVLSGSVEDKADAHLAWTQNTEQDFAGYCLYRDGQKATTTLAVFIDYLDENLTEGIHAYTVTAADLAGNESEHSNEVQLKVDTTGPDAKIHLPLDGSTVSGIIDIKGTSYSADDFRQYRVYVGQGQSPLSWNLVRTSPVPVSYGVLTQWDTLGHSGLYSVKLEAEDLTGNINSHQVTITIDDIPPAPPVFISAMSNISDVTLTWQSNTEPDLSGYLLYRNSQIANASGVVIGDLKPHLISGTIYLDKNVPDGRHNYFLIAADQPGNLSEQSNALEVNIDTRPPHATIIEPQDNSKYQDKILIKAESPDTDIESVQFQYKRVQDSVWDNLGSPVTQTPYAVNLDPVSLGLPYGGYHLKAIATDDGGKTDPSPALITVTYTDMTSGDAPHDLKVTTNGDDVDLEWSDNAESDLDGYNVYRTSGTAKEKINGSAVKETACQDEDLPDGDYTYEVTALDIYGNESKPSNSASAKVYAPSIQQPYTPTGQQIIEIQGSDASVNSTVELLTETLDGLPVGSAAADAQGNFILSQLNLSLGENRITAKATDNNGNRSRSSDMVLVVYNEPPSAPVDFKASEEDRSVTVTWSPNAEPDLSGYNLYRNDEKMNGPVPVITGAVKASSSYYYNQPAKAFDSNTSTYWMPAYSYDTFKPAWWEIDLPSPELINQLEIYWGRMYDEFGNEAVYAGKDFEIKVWSGYAWITHTRVSGNNDYANVIDLKPSYRTDKIRIFITDTTDLNYSKRVMLSEVKILKDNLITGTSYDDPDLDDGTYWFNVTAVDYYGFESLPSDDAEADVGDVTPPSAPQNLTAAASGSDVVLHWTPDPEPDLAGYNIFRNTAQGWVKISPTLMTGTDYTDTDLLNGTFIYRVTAADAAGNESLPSNEAAANVFTPPAQPPINLQVTSVPEGGALHASWEYSGSTAAGYNLYRSLRAGGPYTKIGSLLSGTFYPDSGLTNGTAYYYVVTVMDSIGNESVYSNEATGIPSDGASPAKPVLFFPTISGSPVVLYNGTTDISGFADPASVVELSGNGEYLGKTGALGDNLLESFPMDENIYGIAVSSDGKAIAYEKNNVLWIMTFSTGDTVRICEGGYSPVWSRDGNRIAYMYADDNWNERIAIYDLQAAKNIRLTVSTDVYECDPSWSFDGGKIAFTSSRGVSDDVWIKDINADSLTQATHSGYASGPKLSPDGKKVAYFEEQNLNIVDLFDGNTMTVDDNTDWHSLDWSPDSGKVLFISYSNGTGEAFLYHIDRSEKIQITYTTNGIENPVWSPDGNHIVFVRYEADWRKSLWITSAGVQDHERVLLQNSNYLYNLSWLRTGGITYREPYGVLNTLYLKGYFSFDNISLEAGENIFSATAADSSGNRSVPSDEISVILDAALLPDLEAAEDDIFLYPAMPQSGQNIAGDIIVWNTGQTEARDVDVDIYIWDSSGNMELIQSGHLPSISPDSGETISFVWDTGDKIGITKIIAVSDPENIISERNETNNVVTKEFVVIDDEGIFIIANLNGEIFESDQDVDIDATVINSGRERNGDLDIVIEDENGNHVKTVDSFAAHIPYGSQEHRHILWNTGSTYAGAYKVHAVFSDGEEVIAENSAPFTILADMNIDSFIVTEKISYSSNEDVLMTVDIRNDGKNYVIPALHVKVTITDELNNAVFGEAKDIINFLPGASQDIDSTWNTGLSAAGNYRIVVEIFRNNELILSNAASFSVKASPVITGNMTVSPAFVMAGNAAGIEYTVQNTGNAAVNGLGLNLLIIDPETQEIMSAHGDIADIGINSTKSGVFTSSTQGYSLKTYTALLQSVYQGYTKTIATASFAVKDGTPPVVTIISPAGGSFNSSVYFTASAVDDASGVDRVEYRLDAGEWRPLPVSRQSSGRYAATWTPLKADEGSHSVSFRAVDKAGNMSAPLSTGFTIDLTPPAPPVVSSPPDNSFAQSRSVDIRGVAEPGSTVTMVFAGKFTATADAVTGEFIFAGVTVNSGVNSLTFTAEDGAGNRSSQLSHTLTLDISGWLSGALSVKPTPAYEGRDLTFAYTIVNSGDEEIRSLTAIISVIDPDTQEAVGTTERIVSISKEATLSGNITDRPDIEPGSYAAVLRVSNDQMAEAKTLSIADFDIKPSLEAEKKLADVINLLVWINDDCSEGTGIHARCNDDHHGCRYANLLEGRLKGSGMSYLIVYDKKDFQAEMRNPVYTDMLILGNRHPLEDGYDDELRELVYSGKGLISSLFLIDGEYRGYRDDVDSLFGTGYKGNLFGDDFDVDLIDSPLSAAGALKTRGETLRIKTTEGATVVGWINTGKGKDGKCQAESSAAIVLNEYGIGKTVYYAFDIAGTMDSESHVRLLEILKNSIYYVHKILQADSLAPYQGIPVEINLRSPGSAFDLRITETYPSDIKLHDPWGGRWITETPWIMTARIEPGETKSIWYFALPPDMIGTYILKTDIEYMENGSYIPYRHLKADFVIDHDAVAITGGILASLKGLQTEGRQRAKINYAISHIENVQERKVISARNMEQNIADILQVIDALIYLNGIDVSAVRLQLDTLLRIYEGRYYLDSMQ
jgi:Tol biopolymer transport system component/flagellar hook assembly protein FlgD/fibronectin type 3 domain-containing protein